MAERSAYDFALLLSEKQKKGGTDMKKTFIRTVIYTLCLLTSAILIVVSLLSMFAPGVMANLSYTLGDKRTCVWYTRKEYERNGSLSTLDKLLYRVKWLDNDKLVVKYSKEMIEYDYFDAFCEKKDKESDLTNAGSYRDYICGDYVVALYETNQFEQAINFAYDEIIRGDEYGEYNVFRSLIYHVAEKKDVPALKTLLEKLEVLINSDTIQDDELAKNDKALFTELVNKLSGETNE